MNEIVASFVTQFLVKGQFAVLIYFLAVNGWYLVLLVSSLLELRQHMLLIADESRHLLLSSTLSPTISILAPAYNEEATIEVSLRALLALQYVAELICLVTGCSPPFGIENDRPVNPEIVP